MAIRINNKDDSQNNKPGLIRAGWARTTNALRWLVDRIDGLGVEPDQYR